MVKTNDAKAYENTITTYHYLAFDKSGNPTKYLITTKYLTENKSLAAVFTNTFEYY
jgi:hypothetical protein